MAKYHDPEQRFTAKTAAQASVIRLLEPLKPFCRDGARVDLSAASAYYESAVIRKSTQTVHIQVENFA